MLIQWEVPEWRVRDTVLSKQLPPLKFSYTECHGSPRRVTRKNFRAERVLGEEKDFNIHKVAGMHPKGRRSPEKRQKALWCMAKRCLEHRWTEVCGDRQQHMRHMVMDFGAIPMGFKPQLHQDLETP